MMQSPGDLQATGCNAGHPALAGEANNDHFPLQSVDVVDNDCENVFPLGSSSLFVGAA
jgi:hypothetical protein